jgi:lipopolysaccharide biosynthesis protein
VIIRSAAAHGWKANIVSSNHINYVDCTHSIRAIVERLRREYDLDV